MRTTQEIETEMNAVQAQYPALAKLTSSSQLSFFRLLKNMWIMLVMAIEQRIDTSNQEITQVIADKQTGSLSWYVQQLKAFQFGDAVSLYDGFRVGYATVNPAKQIIYQAAMTEQADGRLLAKVAKPDGLSLQPLTADELTALREYVRQVKYAGVAIDIISLPADELVLDCTVVYDRQVLNANGQEIANPGQYLPVVQAIFVYLRTIRFDSVINLTDLIDYVQKVPGVKDFTIAKATIRAAGTTAYVEFTRETTSRAGHATFNYSQLKYV